MANAYNSVFLTLSIAELSAAAILFVIFALLATVNSTRFFRYWLAGWVAFLAVEVSIIVALHPELAGWRYAAYPLSLAMCACFLAAALDCAGFGKSLIEADADYAAGRTFSGDEIRERFRLHPHDAARPAPYDT